MSYWFFPDLKKKKFLPCLPPLFWNYSHSSHSLLLSLKALFSHRNCLIWSNTLNQCCSCDCLLFITLWDQPLWTISELFWSHIQLETGLNYFHFLNLYFSKPKQFMTENRNTWCGSLQAHSSLCPVPIKQKFLSLN